MPRIEKTVFIAYRRTNAPWALAIFNNLSNNGYDVFFDFNGIASGDFESVILGNIKARAHFLVLLTPSALERANQPGDWLRREIETALDSKRNIVSLMLEGFDFGTPAIANQLTGKLATLKHYEALGVPADYFMEAMERLRQKYLNVSLDAVLHPLSTSVQRATRAQRTAADVVAKSMAEQELTDQSSAPGSQFNVSSVSPNASTASASIEGLGQGLGTSLAKRLAVRLTADGPRGSHVSMATLIGTSLAVIPARSLDDIEVPGDLAAVEFLGESVPTTTKVSAVNVDVNSDFAVLKLASDAPFELPPNLLYPTKIAASGEWASFLISPDTEDGAIIQGRLGQLTSVSGHEYQILALPDPIPERKVAVGAPIIWNGQLLGLISSLSQGGSLLGIVISKDLVEQRVASLLQPKEQAGNAVRAGPSSQPLPFDLGKYQLSNGARTILYGASAQAAENDAPVSTSSVLMEIARLGRPGRERQWVADFLLDTLSLQPEKLKEVMARFRGLHSGGQRGASPRQQESSRPLATMMKPGLAWSLGRAQEMATETTGETTVSGRHLLAALIVDVPQPYSLGAQRLLAEIGIDLPLLRQRMYEWVRGYGDVDKSWRTVLVGTGTEPRRKVEFAADITAGLDLIGIEQDVLALATLIAARDSSPPLSIGLFGDWGSGKTFFMGQLRSAIAQFSREAREASVMQRDLPFYKRIVQIDFNAWHYVEGNLWASMVEHILENLRFSDDQEFTATEELQKHWIARVGFTEIAKAEADKKRTEAETRVSEAAIAVEIAAKTHEDKKRELQALSRKSAARDFKLSGAVQVITSSLEPLGLKPLSDAVADLQSSLRQARSAVEGGSALLNPLIHAEDRKDRWRSLLIILLGAPLAAVVVGWLLSALGQDRIAQISAWATGAAGLLTAGATWVRKQAVWVSEQSKKIEEAQRTYDEELAKKLASTAEQLAKTEQELALARQDYTLAQQRVEQARREQEAAVSDLAAATTTRLLGQFIEDRAGSTDYRKHLGVLALVRQDFQKLSSLIEEDNRRLAPPGTDDQRFTARKLHKIKSLDEEDKDAATRINRIVLYIDDLDRCPPIKVVEVLQAVHLLLAFPLFVVVVGVDARWISRSLESRYRELLHVGQSDAAVDITEMFGVARSEDYLEKIFQIPLWLRRMDPASAQRMVHGLLGKPVPPPSTKSEGKGISSGTQIAARPATQNVAPLNQLGGTGQQPSASATNVQQNAGIPPTTSTTPPPLAGPSPAKAIVPNLESLEIRDFELGSINELAPLLGRSPRALKRFVNLYRLIKAGLAPAEHDAFVRYTADELGGFQAVLFLLAVDTGLPRVSRAVFDTLLVMKEKSELGIKKFLDKMGKHPSADAADWETLKDWINHLEGPEKFERGMAVLAEWVPRVARYSFQASDIEASREPTVPAQKKRKDMPQHGTQIH